MLVVLRSSLAPCVPYRLALRAPCTVASSCCRVHDVCVGFAWFDGPIVFVLVDSCFLARVCYPVRRFPVWISRSCWAARMAKSLFVVFVCLLCLCAGQASSAGKVHGQYLLRSCCQGCHSASAIDADSMPQHGRCSGSMALLLWLGTRRLLGWCIMC